MYSCEGAHFFRPSDSFFGKNGSAILEYTSDGVRWEAEKGHGLSKFANLDWDRLWKVLRLTAARVTCNGSRTFDCGVSADDLVEQTLLAFWNSPDGLGWKPAKGSLEAFLAGILQKKAIDHFRRQKFVAGSTSDAEGPYGNVRAPDSIEESAQTTSLWRALERLVVGHQDLEDLVTAAQLRPGGPNMNQEIGELMGKTPAQVSKLKIKLLAVPGVKELLYVKR
jgi:hypothetical protein